MSDWGTTQHEGDLYCKQDLAYVHSPLGKTKSARQMKKLDRENTNLAVRGMGKTGLTRRVITDAEKMTVCMLRGKGLSVEEIGEKLRRTPESIRGILRQAEALARAAGLNFDWREDLREKAVHAIRSGLTHEKDPYKQAGIGVQTLKGLGEFENETSVNIGALMSSIPENARGRYITLESTDVKLISSEAPHDERNEAEIGSTGDAEIGAGSET